MAGFGRGNKFGGGKPRYGKRGFGRPSPTGRDSDRGFDRPMHQAVCSKCGKDCEVPFRPSGTKPVLCRDCFRGEGGGESGFERKRFGRPQPAERLPDPRPAKIQQEQLNAINAKLDKILKLLELPTGE